MKIPNFDFDLEEGSNTKRFYQEIYEKKIYALENVLDIGANRGLFSYYIAPFAKHVYAVEPHKESIQVISDSILKNTLLGHIQTYNCAIGGKNGKQALSTEIDDGGYHLTAKEGETEVYTLKSFMDRIGVNHVDLMKIDIENTESEVFKADDIDEALRNISIITGEGHGLDDYLPVFYRNNFIVTRRDESYIARKHNL
jgi:FkbM family methyltransferase